MAGMGDSSDDFFNSFGDGGPPTRRAGAPMGAPPVMSNRRAPPPPPQQATTTSRAPPPPPRGTTTVSGSSTGTSLRKPQAPPQKQAFTNSGASAGIRPSSMPTYNQIAPAAPPVITKTPVITQQPLQNPSNQMELSGSDWYSPPTQEQHAAFHYQQTPAPSAPYMSGGAVTNNAYGTSQFFTPQSTPASTTTFLEGNMNAFAPSSGGHGNSMFIPQPSIPYNSQDMNTNMMTAAPSRSYNDLDDFSNEPPLLEELGINVEHIIMKTKAVVVPFRRFAKHNALMEPAMIVEDADLAGPLAFALLLGGELMLAGKLQFGYIYGFGMFGCLSMTLILNLMTPGDTAISFWTVTSILGYALLPVNILAALKLVLLNLAGFLTITQILALLTVFWSTTASTRLLEVGCGMEAQRYLLAYPIAMLYSAFVLITIF